MADGARCWPEIESSAHLYCPSIDLNSLQLGHSIHSQFKPKTLHTNRDLSPPRVFLSTCSALSDEGIDALGAAAQFAEIELRDTEIRACCTRHN